jgi:hypothetical protein
MCGGKLVNISRWFLVVIFLGLSSSVALADGVDPALGVKGGTDSTLWPGSVTFTISSADAICDVTCDFTSGSFFINKGTITNFLATFNTEQGPFSTLEGSAFTVSTITPGFVALLSGGTIFPGSSESECTDCSVPANQIFGNFFFQLQGVTLGSNGETNVTFTSNVPEPGTIILFLSGLAAVSLRRLRRNKVAN